MQIRPPGGEDGQLGPYRLQPFHVQVRVQGCLLRPGPAEHGAPGIHGDGVAVGHVGALFVPGGGDPHGEALVVHCPLAEEKFPVGGAGSHVEGRRHEDHLCPPQAHAPGQLLEPQVEADAQPHGAEGRLEGGDGISRGEGVRLPEPLSPLDVDIKQVGLPVLGQLAAVGAVDVAGVVDPALRQLRHSPAHEVEPQLRCQVGQGRLGLAALRFAVGAEAAVVVGAAEHLRQHGEVRSILGRLPDFAAGGLDIFHFVWKHRHLDQRNAHRRTSSIIPSFPAAPD
ncbi:Magnesium transport protein CorA, partial [Dysosmobacter welbionis]